MYNENNKRPQTEPWGTPSKSLQRSERVESIFITLLIIRVFLTLFLQINIYVLDNAITMIIKKTKTTKTLYI